MSNKLLPLVVVTHPAFHTNKYTIKIGGIHTLVTDTKPTCFICLTEKITSGILINEETHYCCGSDSCKNMMILKLLE